MEQKTEESLDTSVNLGIIGPLNFSKDDQISIKQHLHPEAVEVPCLFCSKTFTFYSEKHEYLAHLYLNHRLIIGDEQQIAIFHEYLIQWHQILKDEKQQSNGVFFTMVMDTLPDGKPSKDEKYYLLCDVLQRDAQIRQQLQKKRLELVLSQHQFERTDTSFERDCLFCRDVIKTTRYAFIEHLFSKHFLQLGKAENLVFIDDLIDLVEKNLAELVCIFCEKKFKDRPTLKEHMRKKGHKRINPDNKTYDRFFLVSYRNQPGAESTQYQKKDQHVAAAVKYGSDDDNESNWSDWEEDEMDITCLFCEFKTKDFARVKEHMKTEHTVNFEQESRKLSFYDRVKMVNFVRRAMYKMECIKCGSVWTDAAQFQDHLKSNNHYSLGEQKDWNHPQYFFSTYEDDAFLQHLDDFADEEAESTEDDDANEDPSIVVYSEDKAENINLLPEAIAELSIS